MPIINEFQYYKPRSVGEAVKLLSKANTLVLAGGTDLVGSLKTNVVSPAHIVDIKGLKELRKIEVKGGAIHIGALVTFAELMESKVVKSKFPVLAEIACRVASVGVRNRATMVGNICSAVPCLDSGPVLVAMGGFVHVKSSKGGRKIAAEKWFVHARKTSRKPNELVTGVSIPLTLSKTGGPTQCCYLKLGRYSGEDLAQASVFVCLDRKNNYRVAFGSVGPTPLRGAKIEKVLNGQKLNEQVMTEAKLLVKDCVSPITDIRATKEYRLHMCEVMLGRALTAAQGRLSGKGPEYCAHLL